MPGIKSRHFIGLGKEVMHECGPAARVADNKNRVFHFYILIFREKNPVQKAGDGLDYEKEHKEKYHHQAM